MELVFIIGRQLDLCDSLERFDVSSGDSFTLASHLFGATKLPQLAKALGQSKRAFKEGLDEGEREPTTKEIKE